MIASEAVTNTTATVLSIDVIVRDPAVRGGSPVVAGTTIRVSDLAAYHLFDGLSPDQLAAQFDLGLTQVHAALAYYYGHRGELDGEIRDNEAAAERWRVELTGASESGEIG